MELFLSWLLMASVQTAAAISPGPAFAMILRNAIIYDKKTGVMTAIGLGLGIATHVTLVLCGIAVILSQSAFLFDAVKYIGAAYLIYIGIKAIATAKPAKSTQNNETVLFEQKIMTPFQAIRMGFLTNLLNPKAIVFFTAVFTQFITPETPGFMQVIFGITAVIIETLWFSSLALFLGDVRIKSRFMAVAHWVDRVCGGLLLALGVRLALSKMH